MARKVGQIIARGDMFFASVDIKLGILIFNLKRISQFFLFTPRTDTFF